MQIQGKVSFQTIQQTSIQTKTQEKSESTATKKDVFESKIEAQKESTIFEKSKADADYYM